MFDQTAMVAKIAVTVVSFLIAGCNAGPLLKTGSLSNKPAPAAPKPVTALDRAIHVGATTARARRCGFYFDAATLRANFLAAETARGTAQPELTKITKSYDYTAKTIASKITDSESYCTKARNTAIKGSLQRALAGDFEPPKKTPSEDNGGLFGFLDADVVDDNKFNRDAIYDPLLNEPGKAPSED